MRAPGLTTEATLHATIRRASILAVATLILAATPEATTVIAQPAIPAPTDTTVTQMLALRAQPAAAASRATSARVAAAPAKQNLTAAQRRAVTNTRRRAAAVRFARAQRGKWYQFGATGLSRYDCSGLTQRSLRAAGVRLPRTSAAQRRAGVRVSPAKARVGDIVSYRHHVGVLVGRWKMVDAPGTGRRILERRIYRTSDLQFRRVIS